MNNKILYSIIAVAFVGGMFTVAYAGPMLPMITFASNTHTTGDADIDGDLNVDGTITGVQILDGLDCDSSDGLVPTYAEGIWGCTLISGSHIGTDAVSSAHINDNTVRSADINDGTIQAVDLAPGVAGVPIGTVLDWWCSSDCTIPNGFAIADGSLVSDAASPFDGELLPNLSDRFVRGTTSVGTVGNTDGSDTHLHSHDHPISSITGSGSHLHSVNPPLTTTSDQTHNHAWVRYTGDDTKIWRTWNSGGNIFDMLNFDNDAGIAIVGIGEDITSPGRPTTSPNGDDSEDFHTKSSTHDHGLNIAPFDSSSASHAHDIDLPNKLSSSQNHEPPYLVLIKIIRIK